MIVSTHNLSHWEAKTGIVDKLAIRVAELVNSGFNALVNRE